MKAVPFYEHGSADVLQYREDFPDPVAGKGDVIVDIEYCGVNHLDIWTRQGIAANSFTGTLDPNWAPAYSGSYSLVWALHVEESRLHTGGEFKKVNGVVQSSYARLSPASLLWYSEKEVVR